MPPMIGFPLKCHQIALFKHRPIQLFQRRYLSQRASATSRILSNIRLITSEIFNRSGAALVKRLGLVVGGYMVLNVAFNAMLFVLTTKYVNKEVQQIPASFPWWDKYNFLQSVITDDVLSQPKEAHLKYEELLQDISQKEHSDSKILSNLILSTKDTLYVSGYVDLLMRYALSSKDQQVLNEYLSRLFEVISSRPNIGDYKLKNQLLRTLADLQKEPELSERLYLDSIDIVAQAEGVVIHNDNETVIIDENQRISSTMFQSMLDLVYFYTDRQDLPKSLLMLLSILRSLEWDLEKSKRSSGDNFSHIKTLETESIPLVKSNISEILWYDKNYDELLKWAQELALESLSNARENYNSSRISKNSFKNLSKMYTQLQDTETASLCLKKSQDVNLLVPMNISNGKNKSVRNVVLDYYFGYWGKILFP